jgi:hypothetical protein
MFCLDEERDPFGAIVVQRSGIAFLMPSEKVEISSRNQRVARASGNFSKGSGGNLTSPVRRS